jgi:type IV pilus assembly protein PilY1
MILPQEATNVMTWAGNLKKYKVLGGTLKDSGNNAIYTTTNNQQVINSSAKDLWSIAATQMITPQSRVVGHGIKFLYLLH